MDTLKSIVVGVDFTPGSAVALAQAVRMGAWNRATVRAVHVIDTVVAMDLQDALSAMQRGIVDGLMSGAQRAWKEFAAGVPGAAGVACEVRVDNRVVGVLGAAKGADLLIVSAFGAKPDLGLGTVAGGCVRHAMSRVLLLRDTQSGPFKCVVACVDFSETSLRALDDAARLATQDGAALHILHVFEAPWTRLSYEGPAAAAALQKEYRDGLERRLREFAATLGRGLDYLKPVYAVADDQGHRTGIVEYARRVNADLIVMGTRGRTNLRDVLLGSTAERTLRQSPCSVLAVKPRNFTNLVATGEGVPAPQARSMF